MTHVVKPADGLSVADLVRIEVLLGKRHDQTRDRESDPLQVE